MRWAWEAIRNGEPDKKHFFGQTAAELMEACIRMLEESVKAVEAAEKEG